VIFRGTYDYSLDAKNRLTVPAKFRASLSDGVTLALGLERCIDLWPPAAFENHVQTVLSGMHPLSVEFEKFNRFYSANSFDTELDSAGRVMVPKPMLEHAGLKKEVMVTGAATRLEVWDRATWTQYNAALHSDVGHIRGTFGNAA
jgi:transcriptional regulator MraZ